MALYLEGDPINRLVYTGLVASGLAVLAFRGPKVLRLLQSNGVVVVFLLYCALSLTWADYPDVGFKRWVKAVGDLVMVLIVVSDREPSVAIRRLLTRTGFLLIPLSVLMIKYYPHLARYYDVWDWSTYFSGVTTNKNSLGAICLLFGLTSAWQFLAALYGRDRTGRGRRLIAHGVILAMVMWLFRLSNSMTALSCFILGIAVLLVVEYRPVVRKSLVAYALPASLIVVPSAVLLVGLSPGASDVMGGGLTLTEYGLLLAMAMLLVVEFRPVVRKPLMVHALVASLIAVPGAVLFVGLSPGILEMMGRNPTLTDRTLIWDLLLSLTTNTWFGTGFENFWLGPRLVRIWSVYRWGPGQAHNGYIEIYLNLGWIGIALLAVILSIGYQTVMTGLRRSPSAGSLMLAFFVMGIVYNFTEAAFFRISAPVWFALLLAITRVPDLQRPGKQRSLSRRPTQRMIPIREHAVAISRNA
jgi:O-antigen ligase